MGWARAGANPTFPKKVKGYKFQRQRTVTVRVFQGQPAVLDGFPSSMNGCGDQQFFIRWRSANPDVTVAGQLVSDPDEILLASSAAAKRGAMRSWGCGQPRFKFGRTSNANRSNLVDVRVTYQVWRAGA